MCEDVEIFSMLLPYQKNKMTLDNLLLCLKFGMNEMFQLLYPRSTKHLNLSQIAETAVKMKNLEVIKFLLKREVEFKSDDILETNDLEIVKLLNQFVDVGDIDYFNYLLNREIVEFLIGEKNLSSEGVLISMTNYIINFQNEDYFHFLPRYPAIFEHISIAANYNNVEIFIKLLPLFQSPPVLRKIAEVLLMNKLLDLIKMIPKEYFRVEGILFRKEIPRYSNILMFPLRPWEEETSLFYPGKFLEYLVEKGIISDLETIPPEFYRTTSSELWRTLIKH